MELRMYGDSKNSTKHKGRITNYVKLYYFSAAENSSGWPFSPLNLLWHSKTEVFIMCHKLFESWSPTLLDQSAT